MGLQSVTRNSSTFPLARVCRLGLILALLTTLGLIYVNRQREDSAQANYDVPIVCPDNGCTV